MLNLGFGDWDLRACVLENRKRFFHAIGADNLHVAALRQIHSDLAHRASSDQASREQAPAGDALFASEPGVLLTVQVADCIPILLVDTERRAIAAIHAGWRGTLGRVAAKTVGRMRMEFGIRPEDVIAALGPGIGRCCYEVGQDLAREFDSQFANAREWFDLPSDAAAASENDASSLPWLTRTPPGHSSTTPRVYLDLLAANRAILADAGVPVTQVFSCGLCTACRTDLFFSHRREGVTGRMMAAIGMRE